MAQETSDSEEQISNLKNGSVFGRMVHILWEKKIVFGRKDDFLEEWIRVWKNGSHFGRIDNIFLKWIRMYSRTNNFLENGSNFGRTDQYLEEGFFLVNG